MQQAVFRFHDELNDFLPRHQRHTEITQRFDWRASVKDMIESLGVPHAEIELIVANGRPVQFDYIVEDGDHFDVYPRLDAAAAPHKARLREPLPAPPAFVLDIHLGRLAAYLRMMGFDALYGDTKLHNDFPDRELAETAHDEQRVLLTRDVGLLKRSLVIYGYFIRSTVPREQLAEVVARFDLARHARPFRRCVKCNGLLAPVSRESVLGEIQPDTARHFDAFHRCQSCRQVYWRGSHYERMKKLIDEVLGKHAPD